MTKQMVALCYLRESTEELRVSGRIAFDAFPMRTEEKCRRQKSDDTFWKKATEYLVKKGEINCEQTKAR